MFLLNKLLVLACSFFCRETMTEDNFSITSHLLVTMANTETDHFQTAGGTDMPSSTTFGANFSFQFPVVIIGLLGAAANALIVYAMIASKQHKKQLLIFNQNIFDLCSCLLL